MRKLNLAILTAALLLTWSSSPAAQPRAQANTQTDIQHRDGRYRLCASDVIALTFPLTPEFDQAINIEPDGFASLAGAGHVRLVGLTIEESAAAIRTAYAGILHDPMITVELRDFNRPYFIVGGEVNRPGKYDLRGDTRATEAIAMAGGFNDASKHSRVLLFRKVNNDWYEVKPLNLKRILQGHEVNEDPEIRAGDMLYVPTISSLQERDPKLIPVVYRESYRLIFFLAVPTFAAAAVFSPVVSRIWIGHYEPIFVEFVTILAAGWLVNVLTNPAYVVDLGTGALKWVSVGCVAAATLNAGLGFLGGARFGGIGVVAATAASQAVGYSIVLVAYHLENRVTFRELLPGESRAVVLASLIGAAGLLPVFCSSYARARFSLGIAETGLGILIITVAILMWRHPMRKQLMRWLYQQAPA